MNINPFFQKTLFSINSYDFKVGNLIAVVVVITLCILLYRFLAKRMITRYFQKGNIDQSKKTKISKNIKYIFSLVGIIGILIGLELDQVLYSTTTITLKISSILIAILIFQIARFFDWIISDALDHYYSKRDEPKKDVLAGAKNQGERMSSRTVQYIVYVLASIMVIRDFNLNYPLSTYAEHPIRISHILSSILILLVAQLIAWILIQVVLHRYYKQKKVEEGSQYAISQLLKYFIYVIAAFMAIENLGIEMTMIWGSAAALLVGIGLGLQQTFNDLISGILLLFERTVEVGDVVEINGLIGTVKKIGIRTSLVETREDITVIVPNSKLTVNKVINWSHYDDKAKFIVEVGIAYGSDTKLVKELLLQIARDNIYTLKLPTPQVRFVDFGDSALKFELHFWSRNLIVIEQIKSDMRFEIDIIFRENNVEIPFPQRDVWIKK